MSLQIENQPLTEPVSLDDIKAHIRLDSTADDAMLIRLGKAARIAAERITRQSLVYKGYVYTMDRFPRPGEDLRIPVPPLVSLTSILYLDQSLDIQTWDSSEYSVGSKQLPAIVRPKPGHVYPVAGNAPDAVELHFYAGYSADGYGDVNKPLAEDLALAIAQLAGHWYDHPEIVTSDPVNSIPGNYLDIFRANKIY